MNTDGRTKAAILKVGAFWDAPNEWSAILPHLNGWMIEGGDYPGQDIRGSWRGGSFVFSEVEMGGWSMDELRAMAADAGRLYPAAPEEGAASD